MINRLLVYGIGMVENAIINEITPGEVHIINSDDKSQHTLQLPMTILYAGDRQTVLNKINEQVNKFFDLLEKEDNAKIRVQEQKR